MPQHHPFAPPGNAPLPDWLHPRARIHTSGRAHSGGLAGSLLQWADRRNDKRAAGGGLELAAVVIAVVSDHVTLPLGSGSFVSVPQVWEFITAWLYTPHGTYCVAAIWILPVIIVAVQSKKFKEVLQAAMFFLAELRAGAK